MKDDVIIEIVAKLYRIKNFCKERAGCDGCPFTISGIDGVCIFGYNSPCEWELEELMKNIIKGGKE